MCLVGIAIKEHSQYPFVLVANRDEFRNRPSAPAHFWKDQPDILGGIDLKMNGTWLGITRSGRIALITNHRDLSNIKNDAPSRGALVSNYLKNDRSPEDYFNSIEAPKDYNGFNLVVGSPDRLNWLSNQSEDQKCLDQGIHTVSNALLDTPWPKSELLKKGLSNELGKKDLSIDNLFNLLISEERPADKDLPETGIGLEWERMLSSAFINSENYGTVCSTVILIDNKGMVQFTERSYNQLGEPSGTAAFKFQLES